MSLKQRMKPTASQEPLLMMHVSHARFVYNIALEQRSLWTQAKRHFAQKITFKTQSRELTELRQETGWLREGSTVVQQGALRDLDSAYQRFFDGHAKYPVFKRSNDREGGFVIRDLKLRRINHKWAQTLIPKVGWVRFRTTYSWAQTLAATSARVTLRNNTWHVSLTSLPPERVKPSTSKTIGIDVGVSNTIATSDGAMDKIPSLTSGEKRRFLSLERRLSRQVKGSARRTTTLNSLAVLRTRLDSRRSNWIEQTTTTLARTYSLAGLEDLTITNMVRKPKAKKDPENLGS